MAAERLQKVIAASGVASRRQAEVLIANGRVTVDGKVASIGAPGGSGERAIIAVDGRVIGGHDAEDLPAPAQAGRRDLHRPRPARRRGPSSTSFRRRWSPKARGCTRSAASTSTREGLLAPDQRRRVVRTRPASRATGSSASTRSGCARRSTASRSRRSRRASTLDEGLADARRPAIDDRRRGRAARRAPRPAARAAHLVSRHARPGLEAPAAPDVRRGRRPDRAPRPRPHRARSASTAASPVASGRSRRPRSAASAVGARRVVALTAREPPPA